MHPRRFGFLLSLFLLLILSSAASAQWDGPLGEGVTAYNNSDFPLALEKLKAASEMTGRYSQKELAECHRYLGMVYIAFEDKEAARIHFRKALEYNPELDFNPDSTSPKILDVFREVKKSAEPPVKAQESPPPQESASGRKIAGWTLVGVGSASALASGGCYALAWDRAIKYDKEDESESRADQLKKEGLMYENISIGTAAVGAAAIGLGIYFLLTDHDQDPATDKKVSRLIVGPGPGPGFIMGVNFR